MSFHFFHWYCCSVSKPCSIFVTPWTAAQKASLSFTISWSLLKLISTESVIPFNYFTLCHPLLFLPSIFPSIRVFSNESAHHCEDTILKFSWCLVCPFLNFINHAFVVPLTVDQPKITLLVLREELQYTYCQNSRYSGWIQFGNTNSLWASALKIKCLQNS